MSDTIERLTGADYEEAMDTMGHAFGFEEGRDFPSLLPQIYRPTDEWMQAIYAIRRDGKIDSGPYLGRVHLERLLGTLRLQRVGSLSGSS